MLYRERACELELTFQILHTIRVRFAVQDSLVLLPASTVVLYEVLFFFYNEMDELQRNSPSVSNVTTTAGSSFNATARKALRSCHRS